MTKIVGALFFVAGFCAPAFAAEKAEHTGFNLGFNAGFQNVRGNFFGNDVKPGPAFKLELGWRILPLLSLETGLAVGTGESEDLDETVTFLHIFNLDARFFPLGAGRLEPNVLAGWTVGSAASVELAPNTTLTLLGYSPTLGAGTRFHLSDLAYVQGDFRYLYTRFTDATIDVDGDSTSGSLITQRHGDAFMVLLGAGLQF